MAGRREIETKQPKYRCDQSFGLAQRQAEDRPQRQRRRDRQGRIARLAAARAAGLGLPRRNRRFREPHGQAAALAQGGVIGGPIRHLVPLLRDVLTAILVRFEWHDDCPRVRNRAALLLPVTPRPPKTDPCNKVARRRETDVRNTGTRVWPRSRLSGASRTMRSEPRSKATVARGLAGCDRSSVEFSQVERRGGGGSGRGYGCLRKIT